MSVDMNGDIKVDTYDGNKNVFLILTGLGGDTKGYQNKYVTIAENIRQKYGMTVFVVGTPSDAWRRSKEFINDTMKFIDSHMTQHHMTGYTVYVMGHSAGGTFMTWYAHSYPCIKRVLAINPVIRVNFDKMIDGAESFQGERVIVLVGEKDQSAPFVPLISEVSNKKFSTIIEPNADHNFTGMLDEFIALPEKYLFND
jgi:alpha/beta superfamily hydrolase